VVASLLVAGACGQGRPDKPKADVQHTSQDIGKPYCQQLSVPIRTMVRTASWSWDKGADKWVKHWSTWASQGVTTRPADADDCLNILTEQPQNAALPDLVIKQLDQCGTGDLKATGGDCFKIVNPAPYVEDFPKLRGRKLLKFPVITLNVGKQPAEILADRSAADVKDWKAYQTFFDATGKRLGSVVDKGVEFYFAGDGHNHWHVRDFDNYEITGVQDTDVKARAEKHGYCMQDNTGEMSMQGQEGVPKAPVYLETTSCGKGLPHALTIIHGLSRGWGDTYPSTLPDQAIDVTDLPDGDYKVTVHADARRAVVESNEYNNTASIEVTIKGDKVTTHPSTAEGGIT
jgi:hypothetical protein